MRRARVAPMGAPVRLRISALRCMGMPPIRAPHYYNVPHAPLLFFTARHDERNAASKTARYIHPSA